MASALQRQLVLLGAEQVRKAAAALAVRAFPLVRNAGEYDVWPDMELGRGAFGTVSLDKMRDSGTKVAVKALRYAEVVANWPESSRKALTSEVFAIMSIRHTNVTQLHDMVLHSDGLLYLVMEYCNAGSLNDLMLKIPSRKLPESLARGPFQQLMDGLVFCHSRGVFHCDLKPANVLMSTQAGAAAEVVKVADFGLAKVINWRDTGPDGAVPLEYARCGTKGYMAPEVMVASSKPVEEGGRGGYHPGPTDMWAAGATLYRLLTGELPFGSEPVGQVYAQAMRGITHPSFAFPTHLSPGVKDLLARFLEPHANDRITPAEMYAHAWFARNYKPPDFRQIWAVQANLQALKDILQPDQLDADAGSLTAAATSTGLENARRAWLPHQPRDWYHHHLPIEAYGMQPGQPMDVRTHHRTDMAITTDPVELRDVSHYPPQQLLPLVADVVKAFGCLTRIKGYKMEVQVPEGAHWKEPLVVLVELLPYDPPPDVEPPSSSSSSAVLVLFRRVSGDSRGFFEFFQKAQLWLVTNQLYAT